MIALAYKFNLSRDVKEVLSFICFKVIVKATSCNLSLLVKVIFLLILSIL